MILLRRKLNISISTAAGMVGITPECWSTNEKRLVVPIAPTVEKIEGLLAEHDITTAARTSTSKGKAKVGNFPSC